MSNATPTFEAPDSARPLPPLPEHPVVKISANRKGITLDLNSLWTYRDLFYFLVWRDVKVRYKQTLLGAAWAIIQPVMTMLIFTLFFGRLAKIESDGIPYPIFAYAGLLPWTFFSNALTNSGNSLVGNANLITKIYFPRMIIPGAAVASGLVDFGIAFGILLLLMIYYAIGFTVNMLMFVPLVILVALLAVAVGMWMSALTVKYRDVRYALPFLIQLWMFASPIIYPASLIPEKYRLLYGLNPLAGIIEGFRTALFGGSFDWVSIAVATLITFSLLVYAAYSFRRMEKSFADVI